jgi:hypothetical protein
MCHGQRGLHFDQPPQLFERLIVLARKVIMKCQVLGRERVERVEFQGAFARDEYVLINPIDAWPSASPSSNSRALVAAIFMCGSSNSR